jgi:methionyl-tRNA formyltransferase
MRIIFMGTPQFSVETLESLIEADHEIVLVVTQPDRPKGRGKEVQVTPVKEVAIRHGLPVFQPTRLRDNVAIAELEKYHGDVMVVVAFGQILPKKVLEMTKYGCINVHASLLPAYRGAAPIQWAIINGEEVTGITTMQMDEGLDTGDMIMKEEVAITSGETGTSLHDKLAKVGAKLCVRTIKAIEEGKATLEKQGETTTEYASMFKKDMGRINWEKSAVEIERLVRGLDSWPGAYSLWKDRELKIWRTKVVPRPSSVNEKRLTPGEIIEVSKKTVIIQTGMGCIEILEIQLPGKKRMKVEEFLRGNRLEVGTVLNQNIN